MLIPFVMYLIIFIVQCLILIIIIFTNILHSNTKDTETVYKHSLSKPLKQYILYCTTTCIDTWIDFKSACYHTMIVLISTHLTGTDHACMDHRGLHIIAPYCADISMLSHDFLNAKFVNHFIYNCTMNTYFAGMCTLSKDYVLPCLVNS